MRKTAQNWKHLREKIIEKKINERNEHKPHVHHISPFVAGVLTAYLIRKIPNLYLGGNTVLKVFLKSFFSRTSGRVAIDLLLLDFKLICNIDIQYMCRCVRKRKIYALKNWIILSHFVSLNKWTFPKRIAFEIFYKKLFQIYFITYSVMWFCHFLFSFRKFMLFFPFSCGWFAIIWINI